MDGKNGRAVGCPKTRPLPRSSGVVHDPKRLATICGGKTMPRTEVTKKIWAYIKKNKLNDGLEAMFGLTPS